MTELACVIDDDPLALAIAEAILKRQGFRTVRLFDRIPEPLDTVKDAALVLLDLHMPDQDGIEILEKLRDMSFSGQVLIVTASTASLRNSARALARAYGLNILGAIDKPLTQKKLEAVLK